MIEIQKIRNINEIKVQGKDEYYERGKEGNRNVVKERKNIYCNYHHDMSQV